MTTGAVNMGFFKQNTMPFLERERLMLLGLNRYIDNIAGEYFTDVQIKALVDMLNELRFRPAEINFSKSLCRVVTDEKTIRHRFIPRKTLRKDELAIFIYNLAPYALLSRNAAAAMAKEAFPNFFSSVGTINSTFTKYLGSDTTGAGHTLPLTITNLPFHSTIEFEKLLLRIGMEENGNQ